MLPNFHLEQGKGRMCVKIDLRKAFDSVDWGLLPYWPQLYPEVDRMNKGLDYYPQSFHCQKCSVPYGLSQGSLFSPYFFAIVIPWLSLLLQICEEAKLKKFPYSKDGVSVSHLLFADDLSQSGHPLSPKPYSGLLVNFEKCSVFCSAISSARKAAILSILGMHEEQPPAKILLLMAVTTTVITHKVQPFVFNINTSYSLSKSKLFQPSNLPQCKDVHTVLHPP